MTFPNSPLFPKVVFLHYKEEAFTHKDNIPAGILVLMLYSWASIPFIYLTSFCFQYEGSAFIKLIIILTFLSIGPFILVSVTSEKGEDEDRHIYITRGGFILPLTATEDVPPRIRLFPKAVF